MATEEESGRTARLNHIFARLLELQDYVWDPTIEPFHSVSLAWTTGYGDGNGEARY